MSYSSLLYLVSLYIHNMLCTCAGEFDYTAIRSSNLDVFRTLGGPQRRACFDVSITDDLLPEDTETFSLSLSLDVFVDQAVRDQVAIEPSQVYVDILDNDCML